MPRPATTFQGAIQNVEWEPRHADPALAELRAAHLAYLNRRIPALSPREIRELIASVRP